MSTSMARKMMNDAPTHSKNAGDLHVFFTASIDYKCSFKSPITGATTYRYQDGSVAILFPAGELIEQNLVRNPKLVVDLADAFLH